jgi:hypothetical protein
MLAISLPPQIECIALAPDEERSRAWRLHIDQIATAADTAALDQAIDEATLDETTWAPPRKDRTAEVIQAIEELATRYDQSLWDTVMRGFEKRFQAWRTVAAIPDERGRLLRRVIPPKTAKEMPQLLAEKIPNSIRSARWAMARSSVAMAALLSPTTMPTWLAAHLAGVFEEAGDAELLVARDATLPERWAKFNQRLEGYFVEGKKAIDAGADSWSPRK